MYLQGVLLFLMSFLVGESPVLSFKGAVFEHARISEIGNNEPREIIQANLEFYKKAAKLAKSQGAEILVFPEYGIFPEYSNRQRLARFLENVPDPKTQRSNPCEQQEAYADRPILLTLSCLARDNKMYIVANMGDIQPCGRQPDCPVDGAFHYNTNAVFARDGHLIAKYHKEHLFGEQGMDAPPPGKQDPTFETDLGRLATFVCFDVVFKRIVEVSHWDGVKAVLLPTMWVDSGPMFSAMEYFQAWSVGNDVPLLAANVHRPGLSSIGSGIVNGRDGAVVYTVNPDGKSKLLVADLVGGVPAIFTVTANATEEWTDDGRDVQGACSVKVLGPTKDIHKDYRCLERDLGGFTLAKLTAPNGSMQLCDNGLCCSLEYAAEDLLENYVLGVSNGSFHAIGRYSWAEENCFLARCDGMGGKACVTFPTQSMTHFRFLSLKANFSTSFVYPAMMTSRMRLLPKNEWEFVNKDHSSRVSFNNPAGEKILVVGLKARPYDRDPPYKP